MFKIGAIGDVLLTTPLIRSLRQRFPAAAIDYATGYHAAPALLNSPHLNEVVAFDDKIIQSRSLSGLLDLAANIRHRRYDVTFVLDPGWPVGLLSAFFGGFRIGFDRNGEGKFHHQTIPFEKTTHDSLQYLALGELLGASRQDSTLELFPSAADKQFAQQILKDIPHPRIASCPGGGENPYQTLPQKCWPTECYRELVQVLEDKNYSVVFCGGPNDKKIAEKIASPRTLNLTGKTTLGQATAVMNTCDLVVTHDNGLMHAAAATGTPTLTLFGPTDPRRLAPLGKQHRVIWKANEPCYHNGKLESCTSLHDMRAISVTEVFKTVGEVLSSRSISSAAPITSSAVIART